MNSSQSVTWWKNNFLVFILTGRFGAQMIFYYNFYKGWLGVWRMLFLIIESYPNAAMTTIRVYFIFRFYQQHSDIYSLSFFFFSFFVFFFHKTYVTILIYFCFCFCWLYSSCYRERFIIIYESRSCNPISSSDFSLSH